MLSKVQVVHLFVLPCSVQCSLSHCQMTETIADLTLANDHTQQRKSVFLSMNIFGGRGGQSFPEDIMTFPSVRGTRTGSSNLNLAKGGLRK